MNPPPLPACPVLCGTGYFPNEPGGNFRSKEPGSKHYKLTGSRYTRTRTGTPIDPTILFFSGKYTMLQKILSEFLQIDGVTTVALISYDGFVIEYIQNDTINIEALGALSLDAVRFFSLERNRLGMGGLRQVVLEQSGGAIIINRITDEEFLVVVANTKMMLGRLTHEIPKISLRIAAAI
jgi:predicted regulator of Ras-like GTPase activity (Roadblock/LC7/MglB family)